MGIEPISLRGDCSSHVPTLAGPIDHTHSTISKLAHDELPNFPLLELPLELREHVYSSILVQDKQPLRLTRRPRFDNHPKNDATALLATNHQVYLEARRIFLSGNQFLIRSTIVDHKWLKGLGSEGQGMLRKVTFLNGSQTFCSSNYHTFNILSKCPNLSLIIKVHYRQLFNLIQMGIFKFLHGFSRATIVQDLSSIDINCGVHGHWSHKMSSSERTAEDKQVRLLLEHVESACPRNCRMHKSRVTPVSSSTVRIEFEYGCPDCYYSMFPNWQWQWQ